MSQAEFFVQILSKVYIILFTKVKKNRFFAGLYLPHPDLIYMQMLIKIVCV